MSMPDINLPPAAGGTLQDLLEDYPDVDPRSCRLLGPTALIVQALMGVLVILSLIYKRHREKPKRPWRIWLFDVSKQIVGQMFVHGVNILISDVIAHHSTSNACVFYFLNILVDTTLGVGIIYGILRLSTHLLTEKMHLKGFESGQYGSPPSINFWGRQASVYVLSLTTMKLLVIGIFALFPGIFTLGEWLLSWTWTSEGDSLQVIFTLGLFPIIMNILQFWLIDSIVKASAGASPVALSSDSPRGSFDSPDREPLFASEPDDEDDLPGARPIHDIENPPSRPHSHSESFDESGSGQSTPDERKTPSSSIPGSTVNHAYPPSISSTFSSPATSVTRKATKRPPPLNILSPAQPAVNSPQLSGVHAIISGGLSHPEPKVNAKNDSKEWSESWDDSDDWASKVGEEEWTGRRMEEKKGVLKGVWDSSGVGVA